MIHIKPTYILKAFTLVLSILLFLTNLCGQTNKENSRESIYSHLNDSLHIINLIEKSSKNSYNKPDSAKYYLEEALNLAKKNEYTEMEANILSRYGGKLYVLGEYDMALDYFLKALTKYEALNNRRGIAVGYNNIAMIYNVQDRIELAINYHKRSIEICKEINDSTLISTNYFNLGISYCDDKRYDTAIIYANKAILINNLINKESTNFYINNLKGRIYSQTGNYAAAEDIFFSIITDPNYDNKWEISYAHNGLAEMYYSQKEYKKSIIHAIKAYDLAVIINAKWDIQSSADVLSRSYFKESRFDSAYKYLNISKIYSDSIFNKEKENQINYISLKNIEFKNQQLLKDQKVQENLIESKNKLILVFFIGIVILILSIVLIIYNYRLKKKFNLRLKIQNSEIQSKNEKLKQINETKDLMFKIVAHDLMGQIGTMVSFTDFLVSKHDSLSKEETKEILFSLNVSSNQTFKLLENLLDWAKSQINDTKVKLEETSILNIINKTTELFISSIDSKNIDLSIDIDENINALIDKNMFSIVIRNLLANAIKFTPQGGVISISANNKQNKVEIVISDSGVGIDSNRLSKLLDSKPSLSTTGTAGERGSGLGLMLCKEFILKMNGKIWVESKVNKGTQFHISLPY